MSAARWPLERPGAASQVLLVGADLQWSRAVRAVAHQIGGISVDAVPSGRAALSCLLDPRRHDTHVLLNPARADGLLRSIVGLTCDEAGSGRKTVLLGRSAQMPSHACIIPGPSRHAIRDALKAEDRGAPYPRPSVATLRGALASGHIHACYQPIVGVANGKPAGFEALARLRRTGLGAVGPEHFVPRIEDAGLAAELTHVVASRTFADIAACLCTPEPLGVALNIPLDVLLLPGEMRRFDEARRTAAVPAAQVIVELTESRVVHDIPQLARVVHRLRADGYRVALDDISPTMPHRAALLDIPFTSVKLDKDIVMRGAVSPDAADFVKRTIATVKERGMIAVVEGVEDMRAWRRVRAAGADLAQGFFIGRPLPAAVLPAWLDAWDARTGCA